MKTYNKRILLSVTGMSPAVVTETLYALVTEKGFIPTEIQVITTIQGKNKLLSALLGIEGGRKERKGALTEFIEDYGEKYGFSEIHFDESCVHIIEDKFGTKLPDIRTPEENEFAADNIVKLVGLLCQDEDSQLHVSIAGGRKTMGFFMGYALSLYGREQDSMSHVLVDEKFETLPNFYYRKPTQHLIINHNGEELDTSTANIMLAEIPWVRLGLGLPQDLLNNNISYSQSVENAQKLLETPRIKFLEYNIYTIDTDRSIAFGDVVISFTPREYAYLLTLVLFKRENVLFNMNNPKCFNEIQRCYALFMYKIKNESYDELIKDYQSSHPRFPNLIRDSKTGVTNKIRKAFSVGKNKKLPYIPKSKDNIHYLDIDSNDIDITEIKDFFEDIKINIS